MMYSNYTIPLMDSDSDSTAIQDAIRMAIETGCGCVLIPPKKTPDGEIIPWQIDHTILLPSNITIVLDGCHLRLKDNVFENIFRSENMFHADRYSLEYEQRNIQIIGLRNATLDGGLPNGLTEATSNRNGFPSIRYNCLILLHNVNGYVIEGIRLINQRWWAINQIYCRNGRLAHLSFFNGKLQPNQDGINVRVGCNSILIEDITGRTGDDTVALSAFPLSSERDYYVNGKDRDIHDVIVRNIRASTRQTIVALRNTDGAKLYRITIENVFDEPSEYTPWGVVKIGENNYYCKRASILGETREITVRNVHSQGAGCIFLGGSLQDCHISDVFASGGTMHAVSSFLPEMVFQENNCSIFGGVDMKNVLIENVFYSGTAAYCNDPGDGSYRNRYTYPGLPFAGCALDFRCMRTSDRFDNVHFRNIIADTSEKKLLTHERYDVDIDA